MMTAELPWRAPHWMHADGQTWRLTRPEFADMEAIRLYVCRERGWRYGKNWTKRQNQACHDFLDSEAGKVYLLYLCLRKTYPDITLAYAKYLCSVAEWSK